MLHNDSGPLTRGGLFYCPITRAFPVHGGIYRNTARFFGLYAVEYRKRLVFVPIPLVLVTHKCSDYRDMGPPNHLGQSSFYPKEGVLPMSQMDDFMKGEIPVYGHWRRPAGPRKRLLYGSDDSEPKTEEQSAIDYWLDLADRLLTS